MDWERFSCECQINAQDLFREIHEVLNYLGSR